MEGRAGVGLSSAAMSFDVLRGLTASVRSRGPAGAPAPGHRAAARHPVRGAAVLLSALALCCSRATAQVDHDEGFWFMLMSQGSFGASDSGPGRVRWWIDVQPRAGDELGFRRQLLVRPGLGVTVSDRATGWLGYAWIRTELPQGQFVTEHRCWQQLTWSPDVDFFGLSSRTRLEQRFPEGSSATGWRFRQFCKLTHPLGERSGLSLVGYDEVFFDLNDTSWGQRAGFSQNRLFAGIGWRPDGTGSATLEVGYLNQYLRRPGSDVMAHILSCNVILAF